MVTGPLLFLRFVRLCLGVDLKTITFWVYLFVRFPISCEHLRTSACYDLQQQQNEIPAYRLCFVLLYIFLHILHKFQRIIEPFSAVFQATLTQFQYKKTAIVILSSSCLKPKGCKTLEGTRSPLSFSAKSILSQETTRKKKKKNRKSVIIINWFEETLKDVTNCINKFEFSP